MGVVFQLEGDRGNYDLQMTNQNAVEVTNIIGLSLYTERGLVGELTPPQLLPFIERLDRLLKPGTSLSWATRPDEAQGNIYNQGIDEEYVRRRLAQFRDLFKRAIETQSNVMWY